MVRVTSDIYMVALATLALDLEETPGFGDAMWLEVLVFDKDGSGKLGQQFDVEERFQNEPLDIGISDDSESGCLRKLPRPVLGVLGQCCVLDVVREVLGHAFDGGVVTTGCDLGWDRDHGAIRFEVPLRCSGEQDGTLEVANETSGEVLWRLGAFLVCGRDGGGVADPEEDPAKRVGLVLLGVRAAGRESAVDENGIGAATVDVVIHFGMVGTGDGPACPEEVENV